MKKQYGRLPKGVTIKDLKAGLSLRNQERIDEFVNFKRGSVTDKRLTLIHNSMVKFADLLEMDFNGASRDDITIAWNTIYSSKQLSIKTKQDEYLHIRQVFKHWFGDDEEFPKVVRGMKRPKGRGRLMLPEEMPSEETIHTAIKLCRNYRDKFFVAYQGLDAGARPIELRQLKWKKLKKDSHGYYFNVWIAKESGDYEERPIRIIYSEPYFLEWMRNYPGERMDDDYVFCRLDDPTKQIAHDAITSLFRRLKKKLGLRTKFSAYVLRHATLTRMGKNPNVPLAVLKKFAGHTQTSTITGEYQHYGGDDVKEMQLNYAGKTAVEKEKSYELKKIPIKCPHCDKSNLWDAEICGFCNFALTQKRNVEVDGYKQKLGVYEKQNTEIEELKNLMQVYVKRLNQLEKIQVSIK
ncbi:MAG: site-specific integrase [Planctomycetes bacterium]|nr:site-specific integrase [Planctomycetota bacterium]